MGVVVGGIGAIALAVGVVEGVRALAKNADARALCDPAACTKPAALSLEDEANTAATFANLGIGVGLIALGVGTYLVVTASGPRAPANAPSARIVPIVDRSGGGILAQARF
jgi:hypothetical protein